MPSPSPTVVARQPKPKTAKAKAKAEANKLAYEARNAAIAARRETLRAITGTTNVAAAEAMLDGIEREQETENARRAVVAEMAHAVYGQRLTRFIGQRPGVDPCKLLVIIRNWKMTQGIVVDHVRPTT
jgi:hypothetical protein